MKHTCHILKFQYGCGNQCGQYYCCACVEEEEKKAIPEFSERGEFGVQKDYLSKIMFVGLVEVLFYTDLLSVPIQVVLDERKTGPVPVPEDLNLHAVYQNSLSTGLIFAELWSVRRTTFFLFICTCVKMSRSQNEAQFFRVSGEEAAKKTFPAYGRKQNRM